MLSIELSSVTPKPSLLTLVCLPRNGTFLKKSYLGAVTYRCYQECPRHIVLLHGTPSITGLDPSSPLSKQSGNRMTFRVCHHYRESYFDSLYHISKGSFTFASQPVTHFSHHDIPLSHSSLTGFHPFFNCILEPPREFPCRWRGDVADFVGRGLPGRTVSNSCSERTQRG